MPDRWRFGRFCMLADTFLLVRPGVAKSIQGQDTVASLPAALLLAAEPLFCRAGGPLFLEGGRDE